MQLELQSEQSNVECCSQKDEMVSKQHVLIWLDDVLFSYILCYGQRIEIVCSHIDKYVTTLTKLCVTDRAVK